MVDRYIGNEYTAALREIGDLSRESFPSSSTSSATARASLHRHRSPSPHLYNIGQAPFPTKVIEQRGRSDNRGRHGLIRCSPRALQRVRKRFEMMHRYNIENPHGIGEKDASVGARRVLLIDVDVLEPQSASNALFAAMSHGCVDRDPVIQIRDRRHVAADRASEKCTAVYTLPNIVHSAPFQHPDLHTRDLSTWRTGICRPNVNRLLYDIGVQRDVHLAMD